MRKYGKPPKVFWTALPEASDSGSKKDLIGHIVEDPMFSDSVLLSVCIALSPISPPGLSGRRWMEIR
jgi:hypothetical protein